MPSTAPASARPAPAEPEPEPGELFSVKAESGHRTRMPQPSMQTPPPQEVAATSTQAVGLDPKLLIIGALIILLVGAAIAFVLLQ